MSKNIVNKLHGFLSRNHCNVILLNVNSLNNTGVAKVMTASGGVETISYNKDEGEWGIYDSVDNLDMFKLIL